MKWRHNALALTAALRPAAPAIARPAAAVQAGQGGFQRATTADGTETGIWHPASGVPAGQRIGLYSQTVVADNMPPKGRHPLIVISTHEYDGSLREA
ncbi:MULTISPECIES: hypothetical protein [unclassified Sphingomonas]|uniref:hypothetical protein n=1 Tax=unclassified Sphingomonas TaxID=196159 RepID=UPI0006FBB414|nr:MULTISPECIES: hypothetical protein [unclassified Sphingomonas]KQX22598.1 hypothetical protein ASD17_04670 [Sphingomonas sp. Root1294]KQY67924.1 hypothetical protein ASD39_08460 [Sphingomonas sp. Root50]KRB88848.1 hypothetical protein ASE22_20810 [Sphingomonas sp. Root720]